MEQRRLIHRGRAFHFVSYDGQPANPARDQPAVPPSWFLMNAGKRWPVMTQVFGQDQLELDRCLAEWLDSNVFG
jgi:hypothetical protein